MRFCVHKLPLFSLGFLFLLIMFSSCSTIKINRIKNYPASKPFVYENRIEITGDISKDEKNRLTNELENYWDDSLQVRMIQSWIFFHTYNNPPVLDSVNVTRTIQYMNAYLNSQGYYYANFRDSVQVDTVRSQLRATIAMYIDPGKNIRIDSVSYSMRDTTLQRLTLQEQPNTYLKKDNPYSKQIISQELDRLVTLYRQNGYYYFTRENIQAVVDSIDASLLTFTLDPFRQAQLLAEAARNRRLNPKWDINITRKPISDSGKLTQYYVGKIFYYPETKLADIPDSLLQRTDFKEFRRRELVMRYKDGTFTYQPMRDHSYFRTGDLYNENIYFKTVNSLTQLGAWQQVDGIAMPRDKDSLDLHFFLVPAVKHSYQLGLEGSLNTADIGSDNLVGISGNIEYTNRNVWKRAIQSLTTFRSGVELNLLSSSENDLLQTFFVSVGQTYSIPKLILPFKSTRRKLNAIDNKRTLFSLHATYIDRRNYYLLRSFITSWGYEWKKKNTVWIYKPINLELYSLDKRPQLDTLIDKNPWMENSFNEGRIISQKISMIKNVNPLTNKNYYLRLGGEEAGGLFGLLPGLKNNIYRFIKAEAEFKKTFYFNKTELATRVFAGVGYNYGTDSSIGQTLPFFKQFFAGGPFSMRAWALRQLGLGSSTVSDQDTSINSYHDRFGDMQLETNIEYRFPIANIAGMKISSALFADIGNIWNVKADISNPDAQFAFKNLYRDLALGIGTGLRVDFSYFLVRLDIGYKVKDPARPTKDGWMKGFQWQETRPSGLTVNNYALQLGIGLPF
jgi:outer membrane protein insertion porin family